MPQAALEKPVDISVYGLFVRRNSPYPMKKEQKESKRLVKTGKEMLTENKLGLRCVAGFGAASTEGRE